MLRTTSRTLGLTAFLLGLAAFSQTAMADRRDQDDSRKRGGSSSSRGGDASRNMSISRGDSSSTRVGQSRSSLGGSSDSGSSAARAFSSRPSYGISSGATPSYRGGDNGGSWQRGFDGTRSNRSTSEGASSTRSFQGNALGGVRPNYSPPSTSTSVSNSAANSADSSSRLRQKPANAGAASGINNQAITGQWPGAPGVGNSSRRLDSDQGNRLIGNRPTRPPRTDSQSSNQFSSNPFSSNATQLSTSQSTGHNQSAGASTKPTDPGRTTPTSTWRNDSRLGRNEQADKDRVRDFLKLRQDDSARRMGNFTQQDSSAKINSRPGNHDLATNAPDGLTQGDKKITSLNNGQHQTRATGIRPGKLNEPNTLGNGNDKLNHDGQPWRPSIPNQIGNNGKPAGDNDHNHAGINRPSKINVSPDVAKSYANWRHSAISGHNDRDRDHRDLSGRWKDGDRFTAAAHIRANWHGHNDDHNVPFHGDWWNRNGWHGRHWDHWDRFAFSHHRPWYWWDTCSAPRLTAFVTLGWPQPLFWDYGPGEYIFVNDGVVYVNGVWFEPAPVFYQDALIVAQRAPVWTPAQAAIVEWLPLGVFAVTRDGVADNNLLVQLAVTKEGVIGGNVFNQATGASFAVTGSVDKDSQRAVWTYQDEANAQMVMESSIYNLTQGECTALVHYGPQNLQVIELVRLEQPAGDTAELAGPG
jgi:hypothetical protein